MKNLKDKVTNICGAIFFICGIVLAIPTSGVSLPAALITGATLGVAISGGVIGYITGKKPDLTAKSTDVVDQLNKQ